MAAPIVARVAAWEADAPVLHDPHFPPPTAGSLDWPCLQRLGVSIVPRAQWAAVFRYLLWSGDPWSQG